MSKPPDDNHFVPPLRTIGRLPVAPPVPPTPGTSPAAGANDAGGPKLRLADDQPAGDTWAAVAGVLEQFEAIENQIIGLRDQLARSHRLTTLGTLSAMVAHEFNNILTPVVSYAQLALQNPDDKELLVKALKKTLACAERAVRVSSAVLGFSRDDCTPAADGVHLRTAIDEALTCMAREPRRDGIELLVDVPEVRVAVGGVCLQQVLVNLVLNAREALRGVAGRRGRITITATPELPSEGSGGAVVQRLRLDVADNGPGVPEAIAARLFEPFVTHPAGGAAGPRLVNDDRASAADAPPRKGTGLGLCICRDLLRAAGGDITVTNRPGAGATFHVLLPLAPAEDADGDASTNTGPGADDEPPPPAAA